MLDYERDRNYKSLENLTTSATKKRSCQLVKGCHWIWLVTLKYKFYNHE